MNYSNIPIGYDYNGVYHGNGSWSDDEEIVEVNLDDYEPVALEDYVACQECNKLLSKDDAITTFSKNGYLCPECSERII
jgi:DNA-directed RNA polymerase subunit RPC12/RpoP